MQQSLELNATKSLKEIKPIIFCPADLSELLIIRRKPGDMIEKFDNHVPTYSIGFGRIKVRHSEQIVKSWGYPLLMAL